MCFFYYYSFFIELAMSFIRRKRTSWFNNCRGEVDEVLNSINRAEKLPKTDDSPSSASGIGSSSLFINRSDYSHRNEDTSSQSVLTMSNSAISTVTLSCNGSNSDRSDSSEDSMRNSEYDYFSEISKHEHFSNVVSFESHDGYCNNSLFKSKDSMQQLRSWALNYRISHSALKGLLEILSNTKHDFQFESLPKDPRTLLSTPRQTVIRRVHPGNYFHFGIRASLECHLKKFGLKLPTNIQIGVNIDGLPISKSSSSQLYPILGVISCSILGKSVFLIGLYHGLEKPEDFNIFLLDFVEEAIDLTLNGIILFGKQHSFEISMFLFDAVAKSSVLFVKGHSGYSSCTKCDQEGEFIANRICFSELNFSKRCHDDFVNQTDSQHHTGTTVLLKIPHIDIIKQVPLDYMHLVCLGVVKKLLCGIWCFGSPPHKFCAAQFNSISNLLESLVSFIPSEFVRKPRSLKEVKRWKATEFRQFLLYTGPVILKGNIEKSKYQNFLTLTVAITILSSSVFIEALTDYAESLLSHFVKTVKQIYGPQILSHNFHNLLHLADDTRTFGPLDNFSNFECENFLQSLLKMIRKNEKPLEQIIRRCFENRMHLPNKSSFEMEKIDFKFPHDGLLIKNCTFPQFKTICFKNFRISIYEKDSCCVLQNGAIVEVKNIAFSQNLNEMVIIGKEYMMKCNFFKVPCESGNLGIFFVNELGVLNHWSIGEIKNKCIRLPFEEGFVVFPLIHSG